MQLCSVLRLLRKKIVYCRQLPGNAFQLIHLVAEMCRTGQPFGVPGDVLARHAQPGVLAVEVLQLAHMRQQHVMNFAGLRGRQIFAGFQEIVDLAE